METVSSTQPYGVSITDYTSSAGQGRSTREPDVDRDPAWSVVSGAGGSHHRIDIALAAVEGRIALP